MRDTAARAGPRGVVYGGGGGALQAKDLNRVAQAVSGGNVLEGGGWVGSLEGGSGELPLNFFQIHATENAFQAI